MSFLVMHYLKRVNTQEMSDKIEGKEIKNHAKPIIPEGMSKRQWKKQQKRLRWDETKDKLREVRRQQAKEKKQKRKEKIEILKESGEDYRHLMPNRNKPRIGQQISGINIIIDCGYDDYMMEKEIVSLGQQITRSYSENKLSAYKVNLVVSGLDKRLKARFVNSITDHVHWSKDHIEFLSDDLTTVLEKKEKNEIVYLSADTDDILEELKPDETYIVGGIVDKGRYKNLCKETAENLGLVTKRLPIDEFIKLSGRRVLTTSHVVELLIKWIELKDWKLAFESVLPARKLKSKIETDQVNDDKENKKGKEEKDKESEKEIGLEKNNNEDQSQQKYHENEINIE